MSDYLHLRRGRESTDTSYEGFICHCSAEAKADADELIKWAIAYTECRDIYLCSALIQRLDSIFDARIERIACDMWFGVKIVMGEYNIYIECDRIEYGLAAAFKHLVEKFPEKVKEYFGDDTI